jgi:hypothetical protein
MKRLVCLLACLLALVAVGYAGTVPATIYDTITGDPTSGLAYVAYQPYYTGLAASFTTAAQAFTLTEVDLLLGYKGSAPQVPSATGGLNIYLFSDSGTAPSSLIGSIGSISDASVPSTPGVVSFSGLTFLLTSSTRYWIGAFPQAGGTSSGWGLTAPAPASATGEYLYDTADGAYRNRTSALQMKISGYSPEAVPEPSTLLLAGLGVGALITWRRRSTAR